MIESLYRFRTIKNPEKELRDDYPGIRGVILGSGPVDLDKYPDLRVISRVGVGLDNVDLEECKKRNIAVEITRCRELTNAVAEFTVMQLMGILRKDRKTLSDVKVGIVGFGRIGKRVRQLLVNSSCYFYDKAVDGMNALDDFGILLSRSDVVLIHVSGNEQVIGKTEIGVMKEGSYLANMARQGCVDLDAVDRALGSGQLAGYVTDVDDYEFLIANRVLKTPHVASDTISARTVMEEMAIENIWRHLK